VNEDQDRVGSQADGHQQLRVPVYGMTCEGCASTVRTGLGDVAGVAGVEVHLDRNEALVTGEGSALDEEAVRGRVETMGFQLTPPAAPGPSRVRVAAIAAAVLAAVAFGAWGFQQVSGSTDLAAGAEQLRATFAAASPAAFVLAFALGVVVAFAPSSLAMTPAVIGYVTGSHTRSTGKALRVSAAFVVGVLVVDAAIGAAAALGGRAAILALEERLALWFAVMVVALVALALVNLRVWRPRLPSVAPRLRGGQAGGAPGAFLAGVPFGLLACPSCTPLLLPVLFGAVATGHAGYGAALVAAFGLGRGLPLVAAGTLVGGVHTAGALSRWVPKVEKAVGVLLLLGAAYFLVLLVLALVSPYEPQGFLAVAARWAL
jgi:cytochrome c-type biogenesis protein